MVCGACRRGARESLLYEGYARRHATGQCVRVAELCSRHIEQASRQDHPAQLGSALQLPDGLGDVALADGDESHGFPLALGSGLYVPPRNTTPTSLSPPVLERRDQFV
jgi:hypothetical protein